MTTREGPTELLTISVDGDLVSTPRHREDVIAPDDSVALRMRRAVPVKPAPSSFVRPLMPAGTELARGRFRILRRIGEGGAGVVYETFDTERDECVALKILSNTDSRQLYRLKNEFRALANVTHEHVVRLHELFADDAGWFFTMDLLRGVPFDQWVRPYGQLDEARLRSALAQLGSAVDAIHRAGKLHRDLKPSNVLVHDGRVVVLDFGLATEPEVGGIGQTVVDNFVIGTPAYMAPEQAALGDTTPATDVYAIGVMLFEALTGELPFEGSAASVLAAKQHREAPRARSLSADVSESLDLLCARLLARDSAVRPAVAELLQLVAAQPSRAAAPPSRSGEQLLGREAELAALRAAFEETRDGRAVACFVSGESGMGKTALVGGLLDELRKSGAAVVLAGRCHERESVPFKGLDSLVDDLSRYFRRLPERAAVALLPRNVHALARLFPVLERIDVVANAPKQDIADPLELRRRAFAAFSELIGRIRDGRPLCLHIDDAQWLDIDSVLFLRALLVNPDFPPALVVLSHRGGEGVQDNRALGLVVEAIESNSCLQLRRLALGPLSQSASAELAGRLLPAAYRADGTASAVARESAGSPYFVGELARYVTRRHDEPSALSGLSVAAALHDHLAALPAAAVRVLELCALTGCPLPSALVVRAAEAGRAEIDLLCHARLARLSDLAGERMVECYHDRVRETVAARIDASQRVAYSRSLARVLEGHPGIDLELIARCFEGVGDLKQAAHYSARAAEQAMAALAFDYAADLYRKALALGEPEGDERIALRIALADALSHAGRDKQAADIYLEVAPSLEPGLRADLRRRSAKLLLTTGHAEAGTKLLAELFREVGMVLPTSMGGALLRRARTQLTLRMRGLHYERRELQQLTDIERERLETGSVGFALAGVAGMSAAVVSDDYLLLALRAGEPRHIARAAVNQAFFLCNIDPTAQTRIERLINLSRSLTSELNDSYSIGRLQMEIACVENSRSRWAAGAAAAERSVAVLSIQSHRASCEIDGARAQQQIGEFQLGEYTHIVQTTPNLVEENYSRERIWAAVLMTGQFGSPAWLCRDDAAGYERALTVARARWASQADAVWPGFFLLMGEVMLHLYRGDPLRAQGLLDGEWPAIKASTLSYTESAATTAYLMRGMTALATLRGERDRTAAKRYRQIVDDSCRRLARMHLPHARANQRMLTAGVAAHDGHDERAVTELRAAITTFDELDMAMYAASARRRLGMLLGGSEGAATLARADAAFRERSIANPEGMTELHCAGFCK